MRISEAGGVSILALVLGGSLAVRAGWMPRGAAVNHGIEATDTAAIEPVLELTPAGASCNRGSVRVSLRASTWPVAAFREATFEVRVEREGSGRRLEAATITFAMHMPMGEHRYRLIERAPGLMSASVVLPACPSGASQWTAIVEGRLDDRPVQAAFTFDLAAAAPAGQ